MKKRGIGMLLPLWVWTLLFVVFPMGYILLLSFVSGDAFGIRYVFTLDNYRRLLSADLLACVFHGAREETLAHDFASSDRDSLLDERADAHVRLAHLL